MYLIISLHNLVLPVTSDTDAGSKLAADRGSVFSRRSDVDF